MTDTTTTNTADLGTKLVQDAAVGASAAVGDAVSALDQWLVTHIHNSVIGQNPALAALVGSAVNALRALLA